MLIDESYFVGPLTIAQLGQKAVVDDLKNYINRWEPVIMEAALGYDFYQAFLSGLAETTVAQRWLDLLNGVVFINQSLIKKRFVGFAGGANTQTIVALPREDLFIYGGVTTGFPVGGYQYTDATLDGWNFEVELFGAGTLQPEVEWNYKTGGGIVLTNTAYEVQPDERWVIHFTGKKVGLQTSSSASPNLFSPLAGFIYYEYMKGLFNQNTGVGIVKSESKNAEPASPAYKMADAYNDACRQINIFWEMMRVDQAKQVADRTYPEFDYRQVYGYGYNSLLGGGWFLSLDELYSFKPINTFGI